MNTPPIPLRVIGVSAKVKIAQSSSNLNLRASMASLTESAASASPSLEKKLAGEPGIRSVSQIESGDPMGIYQAVILILILQRPHDDSAVVCNQSVGEKHIVGQSIPSAAGMFESLP
jgi:hypothetical protein